MSAAALATGLRGVEVVLVESEEIGIVGVGEATFPSIRGFNDILGIDEAEFLAATGGSYKLGIQFCDWRQRDEHYFHTFGDFGQLDGAGALWGQYRRMRDRLGCSLSDLCLPSVMAEQQRFCLPAAGEELNSRYTYAYHFDASRYAAFLRRLAEARGVQRVEGRVVQALRREDGGVRALRLEDGRELSADLFIDCSGFASWLLGRTLEVPFVDWSHHLPVDRAWAVPTERVGSEITPYTRSTALEAGWAWRIPLQDRTGNGHVFSSRFIDEAAAREQLLARLDAPTLAEPRLLRFATGHRERFWSHNVIAIGLAAGFLEPLESTSIFLVHNALGRLMPMMQHVRAGRSAEAAEAFNSQQLRQFQRIRDFILLHYVLSERRDSEFWRYITSMELPPSLDYKLHAWRETGVLRHYDDEAFGESSWLAVYAGMKHWPRRSSPWMEEVPAGLAEAFLRERRDSIQHIVAGMPGHDAFLRQVLRRS